MRLEGDALQIAAERHIPPNLKGYSWTLARTAREEEEEGAMDLLDMATMNR